MLKPAHSRGAMAELQPSLVHIVPSLKWRWLHAIHPTRRYPYFDTLMIGHCVKQTHTQIYKKIPGDGDGDGDGDEFGDGDGDGDGGGEGDGDGGGKGMGMGWG